MTAGPQISPQQLGCTPGSAWSFRGSHWPPAAPAKSMQLAMRSPCTCSRTPKLNWDRSPAIDGQHARPEMTRLSGGFVTLKDEGTGRLWTVQLESFLIGKYAVTQELFQLIARDREAPLPDATKPVVDVSCIEATRFCNLLSRELDLRECYSTSEDGEVVCDWKCSGYRLPSEAEWE